MYSEYGSRQWLDPPTILVAHPLLLLQISKAMRRLRNCGCEYSQHPYSRKAFSAYLNEEIYFLDRIFHFEIWTISFSDNAIPIKSWFSDPTDIALLNLLPVLDALRFTADVRSVLSRNLHLHRLW